MDFANKPVVNGRLSKYHRQPFQPSELKPGWNNRFGKKQLALTGALLNEIIATWRQR